MQERYEKLREEWMGLRQVVDLDQAVMAAILEKTGAVTVSREDIRRCLQEKRQVRAEWLTETGGCCLWAEGADGIV